jgi:hypothetical protein
MKSDIAIAILTLMWDGIQFQSTGDGYRFPYGEINDLGKDEAIEWLTAIIENRSFLYAKLDDQGVYQPVLK